MNIVSPSQKTVEKKPDSQTAKHLLPTMPYYYAALEPHIDERTMVLHHSKHHAAYVEKLNAALAKFPELQDKPALWLLLNLDKIPESIRDAVHHNAGGHVNHSLFWKSMSPTSAGTPLGSLADAITHDFGSFEIFKERFVEAGIAVFGSGWVWLVRTQSEGGKLSIVATAGHDHPLMQGHYPLLLNDVWEHAYYLKHENRREEYLRGWWSVVDWSEVSNRYQRSESSAAQRWENEGGHLLKPSL